ncbi:MAG: hypothetical protein SOI26_00585 [Coriobacteriales bacterium]|jgi:hypothetical protein
MAQVALDTTAAVSRPTARSGAGWVARALSGEARRAVPDSLRHPHPYFTYAYAYAERGLYIELSSGVAVSYL